MHQLINKPPQLLAKMNAPPKRHKCLKYREGARTVVNVLFWGIVAVLVTIILQKQFEVCPQTQPYLMCVANHHCAYIRKTENRSIIDHLPFISNNNMCVRRKDFPKGLGSITEQATQLLNQIYEGVNEALNTKSKKKLLADFQYEYDTVVFWGITRQEIGLWLLFLLLLAFKYALETMGDTKNRFDYMTASAGGVAGNGGKIYQAYPTNIDSGDIGEPVVNRGKELSIEELREARTKAFLNRTKTKGPLTTPYRRSAVVEDKPKPIEENWKVNKDAYKGPLGDIGL